MKAMKNSLALVVLVALVAAGCSGDADSTATTGPTAVSPSSTTQPVPVPQQGELARADVERATETDATPEELAALAAGNSDFAFDLFRVVAADGANTLLSPYSIAAALTMTYGGARGDTAAEMASVLNIATAGDRVHTLRNELDLRVTATENLNIPDDDREPFAINIANSLWGQEGYPFLEEFLVLLAEHYDAGMNLVDFATEAERARVEINDWVAEQTQDRITDLIPEGIITELTRLVLVNAIWFKASWAEQFDPANTSDATFTRLDGEAVAVPFMRGGGLMPYVAGDGYQYLRIPYAGDAAMVIVMPDEGRFDEIVAELDTELVAAAAAEAPLRDVNLALPKFEFKSEFSLQPALIGMGMAEAFKAPGDVSGADFTGITERRELFIQDVVHQAFIAVDETGTEAAAATAVIVGLTAVADPPIPVTIDRPFVFMIEHTSTGEMLFVGQVTSP